MKSPNQSTAKPPTDWHQRFLDAVKEKMPNVEICRSCGHKEKSTGEHIVTQLIWRDGSTRIEEGFLMAILVCDNCGHAESYSLKALGIEN